MQQSNAFQGTLHRRGMKGRLVAGCEQAVVAWWPLTLLWCAVHTPEVLQRPASSQHHQYHFLQPSNSRGYSEHRAYRAAAGAHAGSHICSAHYCDGQRTSVNRALTAMSEVRAEVGRKACVNRSRTCKHSGIAALPPSGLLLHHTHLSAAAAHSSRCRAAGMGGRAPALDEAR